MAKQGEGPEWKSSTRGEQAWKEVREGVASRNAQARKAGKLEREAYEQRRRDVRRAAEAERQARLVDPRHERRDTRP